MRSVLVRMTLSTRKMENGTPECGSEISPADVEISPADISHLDQLVPLFLGYLKFYKQVGSLLLSSMINVSAQD